MTILPVLIEGKTRRGPWLITCDHATNVVPECISGGDLGLPAAEMARHIAYDIGALGVSRALGELLDAPVIAANFSRLVIDPNRGADDPTLIPQLYDGTIIPGNRHVDAAERSARLASLYEPYHKAIANAAADRDVAFLSVHSFTPQLKGRPPRPWDVGVLSAGDRRLADPLIALLSEHLDSPVGDNEPYVGSFPGDALSQHAHSSGRPNVLLEIRQDLITTPQGQQLWATRLAPNLKLAMQTANLGLAPTSV
ncbi:MAG: N-formylglutamate amidohydrolase [Pseudomonadota bacterium]